MFAQEAVEKKREVESLFRGLCCKVWCGLVWCSVCGRAEEKKSEVDRGWEAL
jgi:hypothetical protein